ncbi:hypothetical protein PsYK624_086640 [Phanerochaete sordida]|uniref:C2 domain-containing protein n=1 Tax=Phanerochaete sordida TaxID=48140 RepID=A0A9P3GD36_9APHY|nr:hypothetical protein PsYK624_086640 [Phanerochaete sordida]
MRLGRAEGAISSSRVFLSLARTIVGPAMSAPDQHFLIAKLAALEIRGLEERHFEREVDTFVTVSVDGEQQLETEVVRNSLNPRWDFTEPRKLMVHASSTITFMLYRRRRSRNILGDKLLGQLEEKLHNLVTYPDKTFNLPYKMNWTHSQTASVSVALDVDYSSDAEEVLDHAEEKLHGAIFKTVAGHAGPMAEALNALGHSIESLDQLVQFVDGIVDIHPMCKAAWTLLSSVYKAFKSQRAQDASIRELAFDLKETLGHTRRCKNIQSIPGALNIIQELARLVAECASLMDESMKGAMFIRTARSAASQTLSLHTADCSRNLKKLRKKLELALLAAIHNDVAEIREDMRAIRNQVSRATLRRAATPPPADCHHCAHSCTSYSQPTSPALLPAGLPALASVAPPFPVYSPQPPPPRVPLAEGPPSMPSPSSTHSSLASFSFSPPAGVTPMSSRSSLAPLPDNEEHAGTLCKRVLPDAPYVKEPEDIGAHGTGPSRQQSKVSQAAYQMLWG